MERYIPVAKTRPKPPRVLLLFLSTGCHRALQGTTILSNGKGLFSPTDRNDQKGQRGSPSKLVPNIPVEPNQNVRNLGLNGKPPHCKFWLSLCLICIYFMWLLGGHDECRWTLNEIWYLNSSMPHCWQRRGEAYDLLSSPQPYIQEEIF